MVQSNSLLMAVLFHFVLRLSLFFELSNCQANLLKVPSCLILASVCSILYDVDLLPASFATKSAKAVNFVIEAIASLFVVEVAMIIIWSRIERFLVLVISYSLGSVYNSWTPTIVNVIISMGAATVFANCIKATNGWEKLKKSLPKFKQWIPNQSNACRPQTCCNPCPTTCPVASQPQCPPCQANGQGDGPRNRSRNRRVWQLRLI